MSRYEFKVGDRVRIRSWDDMAKEFSHTATRIFTSIHDFIKEMRPLCGKTATIQEIFGNEVRLTNWNATTADTSWSFATGMLEPAFIAGLCYELHDFGGEYEDTIIKVTTSNRACFHYETIRGKLKGNYVMSNSCFANGLVPLYGKQIGEAIRKWDKEHGKPKVCEVKRKAKVGDTIKILKDNGGFVVAGTIWKVQGVSSNGDLRITNNQFADDGWLCGKDNYIVLENYRSSPKHAYTAKEIAKAKKKCGKMMTELLERGKIRIRFQDKDNDPPYYSGRTYVYAERPGYVPTETYAICSGHDEYNVWVGRCVALCKALKKPIPNFILEGGK